MRKTMYAIMFFTVAFVLSGCESDMVVFDPQGPIAKNLSELIIFSIIFMAIIVLVVFVLFGTIVWKYRERKDNMDYEPPVEKGSHLLEITWFVIPVVIVIALTIPTVKTIYEVEDIPEGYDHLEPLVVHVTSADWKWIFSYPEQDIETVNYLNIPEDRPILFKMTSAGTMQSFWVPALGGQKYTMANMETKLYLVADKPGTYIGRNTSFNGRGYAAMQFDVNAQTEEDFNEWIEEVKKTAGDLTEDHYKEILSPTIIGTETFNGTHLQWINHAHGGSSDYINPEEYRIHHGDSEEESNPVDEQEQDDNSEENHEDHENMNHEMGGE
ncbi:cytochrome aa3 quinol oxidase subunit II [Aquibacillus kalidii]|uniref:cytochrome aa3 quinol oxidase subunit II n=1 Tax=Aquibacillus kalidii TaxID=2762597 RepID=UPI0038B23FEE